MLGQNRYFTFSWAELMNDQSRSSEHQWDHRFMELIDIDTWDWWKAQVYLLRENKTYAEAEALFLEFKL